MAKYIFRTTATMKPYNNKNWWIDGDIIPTKHIEADSVKDALQVSGRLWTISIISVFQTGH